MTAPNCGDCGSVMVLRTSPQYRGFTKRQFWSCSRFPACRGSHGAHADGTPLGIPTDQETRDARAMAHSAFDAYRVKAGMTRRDSYTWLAAQLGLTLDQCHIARFDRRLCGRVTALCLKASLLNAEVSIS